MVVRSAPPPRKSRSMIQAEPCVNTPSAFCFGKSRSRKQEIHFIPLVSKILLEIITPSDVILLSPQIQKIHQT
jgi:hypothetical protein